MLDNYQTSESSMTDDDNDSTQINFDTINLDSFTIQECYCTTEEWNQLANHQFD